MNSRSIFGLLLCLMLIAAPAAAAPRPSGVYQGYLTDSDTFEQKGITVLHYNVTPGSAIGSIVFTLSLNTNVAFDIGYGTTETISGEVTYNGHDIFGTGLSYESTAYVALGSNSSTSTFIDPSGNAGLIKRFGIAGHAIDESDDSEGLAVWDTSILNLYGAQNIAYVPIEDIQKKPVYSITVVSDQPIDITISYGEQSYIQTQSTATGTDIWNQWVQFAISIGTTVYALVVATFYWGKFFLWDNLVMEIALYIGLTGAMAFNKKRDVFAAIQQFFKYQRSMFEFILSMWQRLIDIVSAFRGIFRI